MIEFFEFAFAPANVVFSMLLAVVMVYWLIVALGMLDTDFLDADLDLDADADIDVDVDVDAGEMGDPDIDVDADMDADAQAHADIGMGGVLMAFFYLGRVPLTVLVTILVFSAWICSMLLNNAYNESATLGGAGWAVLGVSLLAALVAVKVVGWPFAALYRAMHANPGQVRDVNGRVCVMLSPIAPGRIAQAEVRTDSAPVVVNVAVDSDQELARGDEAVILRHDRKGNVYVIAPVEDKGRD